MSVQLDTPKIYSCSHRLGHNYWQKIVASATEVPVKNSPTNPVTKDPLAPWLPENNVRRLGKNKNKKDQSVSKTNADPPLSVSKAQKN
ncbi:hypothetical protein RMBD9P1_09680 [Enterococcus faecalis]